MAHGSPALRLTQLRVSPARGVTTELVSAGFSQVGTDGDPLFLALLILIFKPLTDFLFLFLFFFLVCVYVCSYAHDLSHVCI